MALTRPFAYNTGTTIDGTDQLGNIAIGVSSQQYSLDIGNVDWWMGPDEDLGYVITHTTSGGTQPNPVGGPAYIGFWRSKLLTEQSFLDLSNVIPPRQGQLPFINAVEAKTWLNINGYWTSYDYVQPTPTPTATLSSLTPTPTMTNTPTLTNTPSSTTTQALLLNSYSGASFAYSLRKLSSTYNGSEIIVRRNSDNTEQDIGFVGNELDTTTLQSFVGSTNLLTYSENFGVWATNLSATINSDVTTDPIGGNTADRLNFGSSANSEVYLQPITWQSTTYNVSIYAKSDSTNKFRVKIWNGVTATFSSDITTTSTWARYDVSLTVNSGVGNFGISNISAGGVGSIFIWGAQISPISLQPYRQTAGGAAITYGYITTWYDQSGNNINFTQTTANSQPRIINSGNLETVNGKAAIYFDGTDDSMTSTMNVSFSVSLFEVFKINDPVNFVVNTLAGNYNLAGQNGGTNPPDGGLTVLSRYKNSVLTTTTTQTQVYSTYNTNTQILSTQFISLGNNLTSFGVSNFPSWPLTGHFQEIVLYSSSQTSNRTGIESNINTYYSIY
jgi:hypothetical protein